MTRAIGLVVPIVLVPWLRGRAPDRRTWAASSAWLLLGLGATLAPWAVRNAGITGQPALVCFGGGLNFYFGHNPEGIGHRDLAETPLAGLRDPAAIDAAGYRHGLHHIAANPFGFVTRGAQKIAALYAFPDYALHANSGILVPDTRAHPELEALARAKLARQRGRDRLLHGAFMHLARAYHILLLALAATGFGLWVGRPGSRPAGSGRAHETKRGRAHETGRSHDPSGAIRLAAWLALAWTAAHVVFWAQPRFRYPLEIALALFGAIAVVELWERLVPRRAAGLVASGSKG